MRVADICTFRVIHADDILSAVTGQLLELTHAMTREHTTESDNRE